MVIIKMKYIKDYNIANKKVLLRCDFNVSIKDNKIIDDTKIIKSLETINYLLNKNNKIIIFSHLGKVKSEQDKEKNTLYPVYLRLKELVNANVFFSKEPYGEELETLSKNLKEKEILLVENTRYLDFPNKLESSCNLDLSKYWANLGDVFINDAFGTSHRRHASNYGISKYIDSYYGILINEELTKLKELTTYPERPFTVIMGGAKVDDKLKLIEEMLKNCDKLIVGGGIANTFLLAKGINVGKSLCNPDFIKEIEDCEVTIYILTNHYRTNGATVILYEDLLRQLAEKFQQDFLLLPSSIHEVLLIPVDSADSEDLSRYTRMVQEVNETQLADDEILSDHAYYFSRITGQLSYEPKAAIAK